MITRRSALLAGLSSAAAMAGPAFAGAEFWNDKQPSECSSKDASVQMDFSGMKGGLGTGGGGTMGGPPGGGPPQFKAVVRWESAAPVRAAAKKDVVESDAGFYVISAAGLPAPGAGRGFPGRQGAPEGDADRREQMQERMKQGTSLQPKGRPAISPARIENSGDGTVLFFFAREGAPLSLDDKEVQFTTRMGPLEVKAKFVPKDLLQHGEPYGFPGEHDGHVPA